MDTKPHIFEQDIAGDLSRYGNRVQYGHACSDQHAHRVQASGDVEILAVRADMEEFAAISVYESGAKTISGTTQARHVNIFPHSTAWDVITDDGWKLIENSVLYAMGQLTPVSEEGKLATTWGQLKGY